MNMTSLYPRWIEPRIAEAMQDTPVVLLAGPRQAGKTTLVNPQGRPARTGARNRLNRVVKTPKLQFIDAGLLASLLDLTADEVQQNRTRFGNALETFVYGELLKHTTTAHGDYHLMYYRDADKVEVDVVIENAVGNLVGVEVKAAATVKERDLRGLRKLAHLAGEQFKMGVLLYDGTETMPLGDGIWAAPLSTLWGT